jgi:hypothetical protein
VSSSDLPNHNAPALWMLLKKPSMRTSAFMSFHNAGVNKVLNNFWHWNFKKIKIKTFGEIGAGSWHFWEPLNEYDFVWCGRYWIISKFSHWKFNLKVLIAIKIGFET